jgi:2-methylisocitrate lyase-like PEP mutase family enzyme
MANLIEGGRTPLVSREQLESIGYTIAVYPLTMLNVSIRAMREALSQMRSGGRPDTMDFDALKTAVGFPPTTRKSEVQDLTPVNSQLPTANSQAKCGGST